MTAAVLLGRTAALAAAAVLLWAGLEKARGPRSTRTALERLGVPGRAALPAVPLLAAAEVAVALGLLFAPGSPWTLAGVAGLAAGFAAAGTVALGRDEPIRCGCFGPGGRVHLGARQLVAFPLWLGVGALTFLGAPAAPSASEGAVLLAAVALGMTAVRAAAVAAAWKEARGDRRSAQEMFVWLR